jgi:hypothetical protein
LSDDFQIYTSHKASIMTISISKTGTNPPLPQWSGPVYLDEFMAFMGAKAARAEGTAGTVSAEEVAASGPPVSTALACWVLGACIKKPGLQQHTQPCWRATLRIGPSHLLQADHVYYTLLDGKYIVTMVNKHLNAL